MKNNHVTDDRHPGKTALLQWLSTAAPVVLPKAPSINLVAPILATVLMSAALLACGSENASSTPTDDPPAVVSTAQDQTGNETSASDTQPVAGNRDNDQDNTGNTGGNADQEPTATPRPTPDNRRDTTPTPKPTPTPTVVPTPTPDPMDAMFNLIRGFQTEPSDLEFLKLYEYNQELIRWALASPLADFITEEYPEIVSFYNRQDLETIAYNGTDIGEWERLPSSDDQLHIKVNFTFEVRAANAPTRNGSVNGAVDLVSPPYQNTGIPQVSQLEQITDQVPVFSHLLDEPVMEPAQ